MSIFRSHTEIFAAYKHKLKKIVKSDTDRNLIEQAKTVSELRQIEKILKGK